MFADRYQNTVSIGPFDSDADATRAIMRAQGAIRINDVCVFNTTAVATHATNYVTMKLLNLGTNGAGTTVIASASTSQTGGSALVAHQPFPLTIVEAAAVVADGEAIGFFRDEQNTDAANLAACQVQVSYTQVGAP